MHEAMMSAFAAQPRLEQRAKTAAILGLDWAPSVRFAIGAGFYEELRRHYSEAEIVALFRLQH